MAYRDLESGDDVKVKNYGSEWHGHFGVVEKVRDNGLVLVDLGDSTSRIFDKDQLLVSTGNPHIGFRCESDYDEDDFAESLEYQADSFILRELLERVGKLEKEMLDMKQKAA